MFSSYYNEITKETSWDKPELPDEDKNKRQRVNSVDSSGQGGGRDSRGRDGAGGPGNSQFIQNGTTGGYRKGYVPANANAASAPAAQNEPSGPFAITGATQRARCIEINKLIVRMKRDRRQLQALEIFKQYKEEMNDINYSTVWSALGSLPRQGSARVKSEETFKDLIECTTIKMKVEPNWFGVQSISNILHACAKLQCTASELFEAASQIDVAKRVSQRANTQEIANIAWAFASIGFESENMFTCFEEQSQVRLVSASFGEGGLLHLLCSCSWANEETNNDLSGFQRAALWQR